MQCNYGSNLHMRFINHKHACCMAVRQIFTPRFFQRRLKAAAGVMSLLGTGWFVGIFMSLPSVEIQIALQYLFIILNSTQVSLLSLFVFLNFLCADILKELSSVLTQRSNYSY